MRKPLIFSLILLVFILPIGLSWADKLEDVTKELSEQKQQLSDLEKRKEQLAQGIASASVSLAQVSAELDEAEADLAKIRKELSEREKTLKQWETARNALIREIYKQSRVSSFEIVFSSDNFIDSTRQLQYYQENLGVLRENIIALTGEITTFKENKAKAEELKNELADLRNQYHALLSSQQSAYYSTSVQLSQVKSSIKNLTARQEQLILEKFAATAKSETIGGQEPLSEPLPNPSFSSRPAYMVATYGYPHRVGMSQYGAYGRSKAKQGYKGILLAYYANVRLERRYTDAERINTVEHGSKSLKNYLRGIAEMPPSWGASGGMHALRAQVVAARSYALARGSVCSSESCQVYIPDLSNYDSCVPYYRYVRGWSWSRSKRECGYRRDYWYPAVDQTKGEVLINKRTGAPIAAYYSSTAGGHTLSAQEVWGGYRSWALGIKDYGPNGAYDGPAYGNSPLYHTGWGSRTGSGYNPWMTEKEFADIFNARLLADVKCANGTNCYTKYLSSVDSGGWDEEQVKNKLKKLGIPPVTSISAVATSFDSRRANTVSVYVVSPNRSALKVSERDFRAMFNLRSRGTLIIPFINSPTSKFDTGVCTKFSGCPSSVQFK